MGGVALRSTDECLTVLRAPSFDWPENSRVHLLQGSAADDVLVNWLQIRRNVQDVVAVLALMAQRAEMKPEQKHKGGRLFFMKWHRVQRTKYIFLFYFCILNQNIFSPVSCFNRFFKRRQMLSPSFKAYTYAFCHVFIFSSIFSFILFISPTLFISLFGSWSLCSSFLMNDHYFSLLWQKLFIHWI